MIGEYIVNGSDLFTLAGFIADGNRTTSNSIERPRNPKPSYSYDFKDENGIEYDLSSPVFEEPRIFRIEGYLFATSEADYKAKKTALEALLKSGVLTIYASQIEETVKARFKSFPTWERLTKIKGQAKIVVRIAIELDEFINDALSTERTMKYTVESYEAMELIRGLERPGVIYEYTVKADETNGGVVGHYTSYNGALTFFVEGDSN
jgi:hypothetical protein